VLLLADAFDSVVVLAPVGVQREETAAFKEQVGQTSLNRAHFTERPPAPTFHIDIHASHRGRHTKSNQTVDDEPLAFPLL
jgi:hypothetical protein